MCDHEFAYAGVRYHDGKWSIPGGGACQRYYGHVYFCTKCTETRGEPIADEGRGRPQWNTYMKPSFDATPGTAEQCGVPERDR